MWIHKMTCVQESHWGDTRYDLGANVASLGYTYVGGCHHNTGCAMALALCGLTHLYILKDTYLH